MKENMTIEEWAYIWLNHYKKGEVRDSTYNTSYKRVTELYIIPNFRNRSLTSIVPLEIRTFLKDLGKTYSKSTLNKVLICLNGIYKSAMENKICTFNPAENIKIKLEEKSNIKRTYDKYEVEKIFEFCEKHFYGHIIRLLLEMGLRASELCGLRWTDIDFQRKIISIKRGCTSLNGKPHINATKNLSSQRDLPMSTELTKLLEKAPKLSIYVVHSRQGDRNAPVTPSTFSKGIYKSFFTAYTKGGDFLTPHELRHTCGTLLYEKTKDIYAVSKFLGHSSIVITSKLYVHSSAEILRESLGII